MSTESVVATKRRTSARRSKPSADESSEVIVCTEPATGRPLGEVRVDSTEDVAAIIDRAHQVQASWAKSTFEERRELLRVILQHVLDHADELCEMIVRDSGKTRENAMLGEIWPVCDKLRWTIAHGEKHLRPERMSSGLLVHKRARIEFHPLGVIGVICPWNYPLQNVLGPTIPALMAGNAVVVKVSEGVAWSSQRIQQIFDEAFLKVGYSPHLVRLVNGYAETGRAVVSGGVDKVIFTGSMDNGRKVLAESAKNIVPVVLELGGKDAFIVCDDADLEQAAHAAMAGCFIAAGQNCLAAERVLVFDEVYDDFVTRVTELTHALRQGPPLADVTDVGAMTTETQLEIVERLVRDAVDRGATVLAGGNRREDLTGWFFEPTILTDVRSDMAILKEETFGPVMVLLRVRDEEEAIRIANDTPYGLSSTIMTKDKARARRMEAALVAGSTTINDFGLAYMAQALPFGGVRGSGFGRLNGREGLRACTNMKAVLEDRFPIHQPTKLFPIGKWDYEIAGNVIRTLYNPRWSGRLQAVRALVDVLRRRD